MNSKEEFNLYIDRLNVQDVLSYAGYKFIRKEGLKYPCFQRIDSDGRRVRGDKFIVTQGGKCCFQPPVMRSYNVISLIKEHPEMFPESAQGLSGASLIHGVCRKLLNMDLSNTETYGFKDLFKQPKPFDISIYELKKFDKDDGKNVSAFDAYFKNRGIDSITRYAFRDSFYLASHQIDNGMTITNLSFPLTIPRKEGVVGFEERSRVGMDGKSRYKGKARGSNGSEGMWIASPENTKLSETKRVFIFESAYDAMAFYQMLTGKDSNLDDKDKKELKSAVFVSTGGTPAYGQMNGLIKNAPNATFHLGFDNDMAGKQFEKNFRDIAYKFSPLCIDNVPSDMKPFIASFGEQIKSTEMLKHIDDNQIDFLPQDLRDLYLKYDKARFEAIEYNSSPYLCKEDKEEASVKSHEAFETFKTALFEKLNVKDGQELGGVKIVREEPSEGYKDFNDELLGINESNKRGGTMTHTVGTGEDLDNDGREDTALQEEEFEDKKKHHHGRRF
ncbi:MAG: toprim domain-containing protein [Prevotella sp.]|nr:toprim domain-containing protein [Prevotella sp.]